MSDGMDYYDVQAMIRDARSEIAGDIDRAVRDAVASLRDEIDGLRADLQSLGRVLASRTDHLV